MKRAKHLKRHIPFALLVCGGYIIARSLLYALEATCNGTEAPDILLTKSLAGLALMIIGAFLDKIRSEMKRG